MLGEPLKILLAEDDLTSRTILSAALKKWGYDPVTVTDGKAALESLQQADAPRLAILDWNMPEMDGLDVCRKIRATQTSNLPYIILLTSMTEKSDSVIGLDAGANDYINKPYDNDELRARIRVGQKMVEMQSELIRARDALAYEATHDPLTITMNRRAILGMLDKEIARSVRQKTELSIGLCDIDHFKMINDRYGHRIGDEVLCGFVQIIQKKLRCYDSMGRYGGEEFLIITPATGNSAALGVYSRLCINLAATPIITSAGSISITISIGVARGKMESTVDSMIADADDALYRAKKEGRNRVVQAEE
jgi:two-component system cell cycle response regulator